MSEPETFTEQLSRVRMMSEDDGLTWDLSDNDQAALKAVLAENTRLRAQLETQARESVAFVERLAKAQSRPKHDSRCENDDCPGCY